MEEEITITFTKGEHEVLAAMVTSTGIQITLKDVQFVAAIQKKILDAGGLPAPPPPEAPSAETGGIVE